MQTDVVVQLVQFVGIQSQLDAGLGIAVVTIRHDGVDAIVSAIQLDDNQYLAIGLGGRDHGRTGRPLLAPAAKAISATMNAE